MSACSEDSLHLGHRRSPPVRPWRPPAPPRRRWNSRWIPRANLVGPGCADYAAQNPTGPGSVTGMAQDPVAVAASNNPLLTTLTAAVSGKLNPNVNLVDTLNGSEFTVFAPTDAAFAKIDPATIEKLKTDSDLLTSILTYHVVPGQASPAQVDRHAQDGPGRRGHRDRRRQQPQGQRRRAWSAAACKTANATVYLIDTVLMPPANRYVPRHELNTRRPRLAPGRLVVALIASQ